MNYEPLVAHDTRNPEKMQTSHYPPRARFYTVFALVGVVIVLILVRYGTIMLSAEPGAPSAAGPPRVERGPILDRNGRILAIQTELETVWAWRPEVEDPERTALELAPILGLVATELERRLTGPTGSVTIKRTISPRESEAIRSAREQGGLQGIRLRPDHGRSYPEQQSLASVIGFVGDEGTGLTGIEYTMEPWLRPEGADQFGNQVFLTVDMNIQHESERLARRALEEHDAASVVLLTMDTRTGDILGYAALPSFDPNQFRSYPDEARRNRPIADVYEPGSVFKIFSIGSFLQLGAIEMDTSFPTTGVYEESDPPITDLANYGTIDTTGIIRLSSNVGAALASERASERSFYNMLRLFGFGEETGIDLNGEEAGLLARPDNWSGRTKPTLAIGQEIAVTAVQLVSAATVYANAGVLIKPNIIDKIVSPAGRVLLDYGRTPVREVVGPQTARQILLAMEAAVSEGGTARRLLYDGVRVAAKTGTAEMLDLRTGTYSSDAFLASTLAILPVDDPTVIVYMAIDYPKAGEFYGGRIVTPVVREYLDFLVPYLGIPVAGDTRVAHSGRITVSPVRLPALANVVPDFTGLPKRALLPLLERDDIELRLDGFGWVVRQRPAPGTPLEPGLIIELELE
ncbi:MAG: penicillin-binding protein [Spirochaetota bacterium]